MRIIVNGQQAFGRSVLSEMGTLTIPLWHNRTIPIMAR